MTEFERLIAEVAAGSEEAVWELAETYTPYIIRAVRLSLSSKLRPKLDSQDIAQTLWASLLLGDTDLTQLKSPEVLIAFLARSAKNKVVDKTRQLHAQKCNIAREERADAPGPEAAVAPRRFSKGLQSRDSTPSTVVSVREHWQHIISNASERDQRIVRMRTEGRSFEEISVEVQVSAMTARRAIERLVDEFSR